MSERCERTSELPSTFLVAFIRLSTQSAPDSPTTTYLRNDKRNLKALILITFVLLWLVFGSVVFEGLELEEELRRRNLTETPREDDMKLIEEFRVSGMKAREKEVGRMMTEKKTE